MHAQPARHEIGWLALPIGAAALFLALALHAARLETPTIDEFAHVPAGYAHAAAGRFDVHSKNPPLAKLLLALPGVVGGGVAVPAPHENPFAWGPWHYGRRFMDANGARYFDVFFRARAVAVAATLAAAALVFAWGRALFGARAAAVATALFLLCPTLLAHGHLATLDAVTMLAMLASAYAVRGAVLRPSLARWAAAGVVWGLALLCKFTALLLLPAYAALALAARGREWRRGAGDLAALALTALLLVNAGMAFRGSGDALGGFRFGSDFARGLQGALPAWLPVPLPRDYLRGFDAVQRDVEHGEFPAYLRGEWSQDGWWYYEAVALWVKTPEPVLALLLACPFFVSRARLPRRELAALLAPLAAVGLAMTGLNRLNIGLRYLLPIFPFLFLAIGACFARSGRAPAFVAGLAVAYSAATALAVHPAHLAYFNLLSGGPANGHRWLLDSNLDWGQDLYRLPAELAARGVREPVKLLYFGHVDPRLYGIDSVRLPPGPAVGVVAVSVTYLMGFSYPVTTPDGRFVPVGTDHVAWLRGREPDARLGSLWLFDLREAAR
jgi:hypothetical protein